MNLLNDKSLGYAIVIISITCMLGYLIWLTPGHFGLIRGDYSIWAIKLPVILAVYMVFLVFLWIGYTLATTPPPVPLNTDRD